MAIKLEFKRWEPELESKYLMNPVGGWDEATLKRFSKWSKDNGVPIPHPIGVRLSGVLAKGKDRKPERRKDQSTRAYRRALRKWRKTKHGSIRKMRKAKAEQLAKEQRWSVFMEQKVPLRDVEAILWLMRKTMWEKRSYGSGYRGYLNTQYLEQFSGGTLPQGFDFEAAFNAEFYPANEKHGKREKPILPAEKTHADKWREKIGGELHKAVRKAGFRLRHTQGEVRMNLINSGSISKSDFEINDLSSRSRGYGRNRRSTDITISVRTSWYRTVFKTGLYNAFGTGTLVLDSYLSADKQRTVIVLARQPSEHRYKTEVVYGFLGRDAAGNHLFMEE